MEISDFLQEDDIWVRITEEKGTDLLERFLMQTDQGNEKEMKRMIQRLKLPFENDLTTPYDSITGENVNGRDCEEIDRSVKAELVRLDGWCDR